MSPRTRTGQPASQAPHPQQVRSNGMEWSEQKFSNYHLLQWVHESTLIETLADICGHGQDLLELGCGTGVMIGRLSSQFVRCIGADPAANLLERAPRRPNIEYIPKCLEEMDFQEAFDCVLLRNTLHHLKDPEAGIAQAMKALRPGGRVVLCEGVPPDSRVKQFYTDLFALFDNRHILTEGDLVALLRMNGFRQISLRPYFMENVDLIDWLKKVSKDESIYQQALKMHQAGDSHFRRIYEVTEQDNHYTMTWRFTIATGVKP